MDNISNLPAIVWLKMTDYTHSWMQHELGGELRIKNLRVISVQHLDGARDILRMNTAAGDMDPRPVVYSMSSKTRNSIDAYIDLYPETIKDIYGLTANDLQFFAPIECPKMCVNYEGVLRPWTLDVNFSKRQAKALQGFIRERFWNAVEVFDRAYAAKMDGKRYPAVDMIEDFCAETGTPDIHVDALRREWQRRAKR